MCDEENSPIEEIDRTMANPRKIVSLVPSLTELLIALGFKDQLVGRTRFCVHPVDKITDIEIIGGTKNPKVDKIVALGADLIVANKEENRKEDVERLREHAEVLLTEIDSIEEAILTINELAEALGAEDQAKQLIEEIMELLKHKPEMPPLSVAYFIWKDPWMSVGGDTYIHDVLQEYKLENVFAGEDRYPKTSLEELAEKNPDLILLSSEPYPFKEKHLQEVEEACPASRIQLVNGEWFSWYGARMVPAFTWLNSWRNTL